MLGCARPPVGTDVVAAAGLEVGDPTERQPARSPQQAAGEQEVGVVARVLRSVRGPVEVLEQGEVPFRGEDGWDLGVHDPVVADPLPASTAAVPPRPRQRGVEEVAAQVLVLPDPSVTGRAVPRRSAPRSGRHRGEVLVDDELHGPAEHAASSSSTARRRCRPTRSSRKPNGGGPPGHQPAWALARSPERLRSSICSRSYWATDDRMLRCRRPAGPRESNASCTDTNWTPRSSSSPSVADRCRRLRPNRSRRATTTTSTSRRRQASSSSSSPGRLARTPLTPSSL